MERKGKSMDEIMRPFLEAKESGQLAKYYLTRFYSLRDDYSDELPDPDADLSTILDKLKCRGEYLSVLLVSLDAAIINGAIIDPDVIKEIDEFRNREFNSMKGKYSSNREDKSRLTTPEELELINTMLNRVITYLETQTSI